MKQENSSRKKIFDAIHVSGMREFMLNLLARDDWLSDLSGLL